MPRRPEEFKKVTAAYVVANKGRGGGCMVEILECKHALEVSRSVHAKGKGRSGRVCPICEKAEPAVPPIGKRELAALVKRMGGADALLEFLVGQEKWNQKRRANLKKAQAKRWTNGHADPPATEAAA